MIDTKNTEFWQQPAPMEAKKGVSVINMTLEKAEKVAWSTQQMLDIHGYCLWRCELLDNEIIIVVRDNISENVELPAYPVYTIEELGRMVDLDKPEITLIHSAKKHSGAEVISVEKK